MTHVLRKLIISGLLAVLLTGLVMPSFAGRASAASPVAPVASAAHSHAELFDKTRFLLHVGAAYFAFHHFVWARYKQGGFANGAPHRTSNLIKAGIALLFTYHELKVAYGIANKSHSSFLHALVSPLNALIGKSGNIANSLKSGHFNAGDLLALYGAVNVFSHLAGGIKDVQVPVPGA